MTSSWSSSELSRANISLPLGTLDPIQLQSTSTQISFDPLALLAVLHNPRAAGSAARLYTQQNSPVFRWPHTMMIGGALPPFKMLIDHLVSQRYSLHPAVEMSKADTAKLEVRSTISGGGYSELPITRSNLWLSDLLNFKPSSRPLNDIQIVYIDDIHGTPKATASSSGTANQAVNSRFQRAVLFLINWSVVYMLAAGCVVSVLLADMWSAALFGAYTLHSLASIAVSYAHMIRSYHNGFRVLEDQTIRYAVYQRPAGGKIIFKGRQDTLETWARTTWTFQSTPLNNAVHWSWMVTGFFSAAASVVCMVNMRGYLQLAYLGVLLVSSILEILVTIIARHITRSAIHYGDICIIRDNDSKWTRNVLRAALEVGEHWSLNSMPWIELGLLPDTKIWKNFCELLPKLRRLDQPMPRAAVIGYLSADTDGLGPLIDMCANEIDEAQLSRTQSLQKQSTQVSVKAT